MARTKFTGAAKIAMMTAMMSAMLTLTLFAGTAFGWSDRERDRERQQREREWREHVERVQTSSRQYTRAKQAAFVDNDLQRGLEIINAHLASISGTDSDHLHLRGLIHLFMGNMRAAQRDFEEVNRVIMGGTLRDSAERYRRDIADLTARLRKEDGSLSDNAANLYAWIGILRLMLEEFDAAAVDFENARRLDADNAFVKRYSRRAAERRTPFAARDPRTQREDAQRDAERDAFLRPHRSPALKLDFPLYDAPHLEDAMSIRNDGFIDSYKNMSMAQSLAVATNVVSLLHFGFEHYFGQEEGVPRSFWAWAGALLLYYSVTMTGPGGHIWLHEEYHRAPMSRFGVDSYNSVNRRPFNFTAGYQYAAALPSPNARWSEYTYPDRARVTAAGFESGILLVSRLQRNNFFYNQQLPNEYINFFIVGNHIQYMLGSAGYRIPIGEAGPLFKHGDLTGWTRQVFRPGEPFPDGFNSDHLTNDERRYMNSRIWLEGLNFVSPMTFGLRRLPGGTPDVYVNFALRHYLTSFGSNVMAEMYYQRVREDGGNPFNMAFSLHLNMNYKNYFPALEAEIIDYPFDFGPLRFLLSPRVIAGIQPEDQQFKTATSELLYLLGLRLDFRATRNIYPFAEFETKSDGWVAGNVYLNAVTSIRSGLSLRF